MSPFLEVPTSEWVGDNELAFAIFDRFPAEMPELPPAPTVVQREALSALETTSQAGFGAGM